MTDPEEHTEANPHPASNHRTPNQIASDAKGRSGPRATRAQPVRDVDPNARIDHEPASDKARREAVKHSVRKSAPVAGAPPANGPQVSGS